MIRRGNESGDNRNVPETSTVPDGYNGFETNIILNGSGNIDSLRHNYEKVTKANSVKSITIKEEPKEPSTSVITKSSEPSLSNNSNESQVSVYWRYSSISEK